MSKEGEEQKYAVGTKHDIPLDKIKPNPHQPRQYLDDEALEALTQSIEAYGLLQPICVVKSEGDFILVAGQRRMKAFEKLGKDTIPAIIVHGDPEDLAIIENIVREDLHPVERAEAIQAFKEKHSLKDKMLTNVLGLTASTISIILSLNKLPETIKKEALKNKHIPLRVLGGIARKKNPEQQQAAFEHAQQRYQSTEKRKRTPSSEPQTVTPFNVDAKRQRLSRIKTELDKLKDESSENILLLVNELDDIMNIMKELHVKLESQKQTPRQGQQSPDVAKVRICRGEKSSATASE